MTDAPIHVPLDGPLVETRFVERPNRFLLRCRLPPSLEPGTAANSSPPHPGQGAEGLPPSGWRGGRVVDVHMADPGRLEELLLPDKRVWIRWAASPTRKTDWSAVLVESPDGDGLVSVDTTMPNKLIHRALEADALDEFENWTLERAEFAMGSSRIDFLLAGDEVTSDAPASSDAPVSSSRPADPDRVAEPRAGYRDAPGGRKLALEVKSVTLVEDGVALFPDAVTARGARHVRELAEVVGRIDDDGVAWSAAVLFVLQRDDAHRIEAARSIDPDFAEALAEAKEAGVRVLGRRCRVTKDRLELGEPVPAS